MITLEIPNALRARGPSVASIIGLAGAVVLIVRARYTGQAIMPSYLFVWLFFLGLSLGSMALVFVHNLTGGAWGELARSVLDPLVRMLPYTALLALPLLLRLPELYPWMRSSGPVLPDFEATQDWYLNIPFFWIRCALYFLIWIALSVLLHRWSPMQGSEAQNARPPARLLSAVGLPLYLLTTTFASIDWTMSLTPHWYSTEFGLLTAFGQSLSALAFAILGSAWYTHGDEEALSRRFHDLGNLLLALVLFWSYLAFMQFLIMWIEDLPHDISWYLPRAQEGWASLTLFLAVAHFAIPFLLLLFRRFKRAPRRMGLLAAILLLACLADTFWLVIPPFRPQAFELQWNDLFALLGVGGIWLGLLLRLVPGGLRVDNSQAQFLAQEIHHA